MAKMKRKTIIIISIISAVIVALGVVLFFTISNYLNDKKDEEERARLIKEYFDNKIATYEQENATNPNYEIIFLGDSLTDGCDINNYYGEYSASNRGIGGDTTYGLLDRLQVSAYDANPKVIVLLIGGNDILGGKSVESVCDNYEKIITGIQEHLPDTKIVWCSLNVLGDRWAKYNDTCVICNQKIKMLAQKYGCSFVDLYTPLCNLETGEIYQEYTYEGVHLTDKGYLVVSSTLKEYLKDILGH